VCACVACSDENLRLLFTILEKAPEAFVRSDIVIALSDLASRHHNLIASWMTKIHSRLQDSDSSVRKNSLMVLSHLILNEMIKVVTQTMHAAVIDARSAGDAVVLTRST
jgi:hypothetical protein